MLLVVPSFCSSYAGTFTPDFVTDCVQCYEPERTTEANAPIYQAAGGSECFHLLAFTLPLFRQQAKVARRRVRDPFLAPVRQVCCVTAQAPPSCLTHGQIQIQRARCLPVACFPRLLSLKCLQSKTVLCKDIKCLTSSMQDGSLRCPWLRNLEWCIRNLK